jgi:hypothetical protein
MQLAISWLKKLKRSSKIEPGNLNGAFGSSSSVLKKIKLTASLRMLSPKMSEFSFESTLISLNVANTDTGSVALKRLEKIKQW